MTKTPERAARPRRDLHGILLLDKPAGISSNRALQRARRALGAAKAGHAGSLDPLATGMLPVCLGDATRVSQLLLDADKTYTATMVLGIRTDTGDAEGETVAQAPVPDLDREGWQAVADRFLGPGTQVPPMYSALKQDGRRLYQLARAGKSVERAPRPVRIDRCHVSRVSRERVAVEIQCSKGTYIRTLVEDIARAANTEAHTVDLRRERVAPFDQPMVTLAELEALPADAALPDGWLLPPDAGLVGWPDVVLDDASAARFCQGQRLGGALSAAGNLRVHTESGAFLGTAECRGDGVLRPTRVMAGACANFTAELQGKSS